MSRASRSGRAGLLLLLAALAGSLVGWYLVGSRGEAPSADGGSDVGSAGPAWVQAPVDRLASQLAARGEAPFAGNPATARNVAAARARAGLAAAWKDLRARLAREWREEAGRLDPPFEGADLPAPGPGDPISLPRTTVLAYHQGDQRLHAVAAFDDPGAVVAALLTELGAREGQVSAAVDAARTALGERLVEELLAARDGDPLFDR